jgi:hypothetical protein
VEHGHYPIQSIHALDGDYIKDLVSDSQWS